MKLYYLPGSAPCRAVLLTARALNLKMDLQLTNFLAGANKTPTYILLNPQQTIPTLVDDGFALAESRAIMIYLVDKYAKNDKLYPRDPRARAIVNHRLFFDMGTVYQRFSDYWFPQLHARVGDRRTESEKYRRMTEAIKIVNTYLERSKYVAGNHITLADLSLISTISTYEVSGFDFSTYPRVRYWVEDCKKNIIGYYINEQGARGLKNYFDKKKYENK